MILLQNKEVQEFLKKALWELLVILSGFAKRMYEQQQKRNKDKSSVSTKQEPETSI